MASPTKLNLTIYQGSTFTETIRWEGAKKIYKNITGISQAAPCVVTCTSHGAPDGWRVKITNVAGMKEINDALNYKVASVTTVNTLEFNDINAVGFSTYTSGGILEYQEPVDLTGYTARLQIRGKITDTATLLSITDTDSIAINNTNKTITISIPATISAAFTWTSGVYSLELVSPGGVVTTLVAGNVTIKQEVTR